jgi:hypothetical protein
VGAPLDFYRGDRLVREIKLAPSRRFARTSLVLGSLIVVPDPSGTTAPSLLVALICADSASPMPTVIVPLAIQLAGSGTLRCWVVIAPSFVNKSTTQFKSLPWPIIPPVKGVPARYILQRRV